MLRFDTFEKKSNKNVFVLYRTTTVAHSFITQIIWLLNIYLMLALTLLES